MSKKLKNSDAGRPFSKTVLAAARKVSRHYHVVIEETDGIFLGSGLEMPLVMADGRTPAECLKNTREALLAASAALIERGDCLPQPMDQLHRTIHVDLRLTGYEKRVIEPAARRRGYDGVSEFLRVTALNACHS